MMTTKRLKMLLLVCSLLAMIFVVGVYADADESLSSGLFNSRTPECDTLEASTSYRCISNETAQAMLAYIYPQVKNAALNIDLSRFEIPYTQDGANDVWDVWDLMTYTYRDVEYYARPIYPEVFSGSTGEYVGTIEISTYKVWPDSSDPDQSSKAISTSQILEINKKIDEKVDEIVSQISPEMSDLEVVLLVHDWLCINGEYDNDRLNNNTIPRTSYDIRGILLHGIGVCQSYTWTFDYVMDKFGIPCINVTSNSMNHTWNQVQVGGYWYNMDITWDDPVSDILGQARHYYFLCSDSLFQSSRNHSGYYDGVACTSTKYDSAFWYDIDTPMPYIGGETFYVKQTEGAIKAIDIDTMASSSIRTLRTLTDGWSYYFTHDNYNTCYFTFLFKYGNRIYFNLADEIACINADGTGYQRVKAFSTTDSYWLYGMALKGTTLHYSYVGGLNDTVSSNGSIDVFLPITAITLPFENAKLRCGYWALIEATVNSGADPSRIIWTSSDPSVASVEAGGKVNAKKYGVTVITATSPDNSSVKAVMNLTIYEPTTSISLSGNTPTIALGFTSTLRVTVNTGALLQDIAWTSSDPSVLSVDGGTVKANALGTATITAKSIEDPTVYATLVITVAESRAGDPNGDCLVNAKDAVLISQYLAGWSVGYDMLIADVNGDGKVNATDAVIVAQYIAGWDVDIG